MRAIARDTVGRDVTALRAVALAAVLLPCSIAVARPATSAIGEPDRAPVYDVSVTLDLDAGTYAGRELVRFVNRGSGSVNTVFFNLYPNVGSTSPGERMLVVRSARVAKVQAVFKQQGAGLFVRLSESLDAGASVDVELEFDGRAKRISRAQSGLAAHVSDQVAVVLAPNQRRVRRGSELDVVGEDAMLLGNPFPALSLDGTDGWTREVTAGDYAFADANSYRIAVDAPADVDVIASGSRSTVTDGDSRVFEGDALRSIAIFAARGFVRREDEAAGVRLVSLARPSHEAAAVRALSTLSRAVAVYSDLFGPPPVRELAVVESPLAPGMPSAGFSGVIAIASAYFIDMRGPEAKDLPGFIKDTTDLTKDELEFSILHETARAWWGEGVGSDPQRAAFLDEGLATYCALIAVERARGPEAAADVVEQRARAPYRVFRMFGGLDTTVRRSSSDFPNYFAYSAIVDAKSAMFVAALRKQLGDEVFFSRLRRYYDMRSGRIARPEDFEAAMTTSADHDAYDRLYQRWIEQRHGDEDIGAPEYAVAVDPSVANEAKQPDPDQQSGFERFGRFIGRKFAWFGKTAAKPF